LCIFLTGGVHAPYAPCMSMPPIDTRPLSEVHSEYSTARMSTERSKWFSVKLYDLYWAFSGTSHNFPGLFNRVDHEQVRCSHTPTNLVCLWRTWFNCQLNNNGIHKSILQVHLWLTLNNRSKQFWQQTTTVHKGSRKHVTGF